MSEAQLADETFERDPAFELRDYARRSFGTFQENPVLVVLRFDVGAARDASSFVFHPNQCIEENGDGSLTVRLKAGGIDEMCWHLFTWGESVTVERPARLRRRLTGMCEALAAYHRQITLGHMRIVATIAFTGTFTLSGGDGLAGILPSPPGEGLYIPPE